MKNMINNTNKSKSKHILLVAVSTIFFIGITLLAEGADVDSKEKSKIPAEQRENPKYIQHLEKRISELEATVNKLLEDRKKAAEVSAREAQPASEDAKEKKVDVSTTEKTEAEDGWGEEPAVTKAVEGRDKDARRRVTELETWKRKEEAKKAEKEREESKKVKFEWSGKYKLHLNIRDNLNLNNPNQEWEFDNGTYFDQRFMLKMEATYDPIAVVFTIDKGNFVFDWKEDSEGTLERWGDLFTVGPEFVRELYVQYTGKFRVKAGRQNITEPSGGVILEGPGDGLMLTTPSWNTSIGGVSTSFAYLALAGGFSDFEQFHDTGGPPSGQRDELFASNNKLDGYYLTLSYKPLKWLHIEPYALAVNDRGEFGDADLNLDKDFNRNTLPRDGNFEPLYVGGSIKSRAGKFSSQADFIWVTGSHDNNRDINAYAALLNVDYEIFNNFSIGIEGALGSGDKIGDSATDDVNTFFGLWICKDRRKYANIFSEDLRAGYFFWDSSLANVTFVKAKLGFNPLDKLNMELAGLRLWTTEDVFKGRGPIWNTFDWSSGTSTTTETTRDIGWEVDFNVSYQLFERLKVYALMGYFIPGDVYQQADGDSADPATEIVIGTEFVF
jgi:hypothetical protein